MTIVGVAQEWSVSFAFWWRANGFPRKLQEIVTGQDPAPKAQEKQEDRDVRISRIEIYPGNVTITEGQTVIFTAVAYDYQDSSVGGVRFTWRGHDVRRDRPIRVSKRGDFTARVPGTYTVTAEAAGQQAQVTVTVTEGGQRESEQPDQSAPTTRQVSSRDLPTVASTSKPKGGEQRSAHTRSSRSSKFAKTSLGRAFASAPSVTLPLLNDAEWDSGNYWSADEPGNQVGNPLGTPQDDGAGSGNFQLAAPVVGLPGRGIDISLGLAYNSRLWNKANSEISYDIDKGWPGPGWNLGFGKLLGMGVLNGSMIVDPDGTRRLHRHSHGRAKPSLHGLRRPHHGRHSD